jgi:Integrase core domain
MELGDEQPFRLLIHDRDAKFGGAFDEVFRSEGMKVIRTPVRAPNANAHAERLVRTVRSDCLDRILVVGRRQLERVLGVYVRHYNEHPHATKPRRIRPPDRTRRTTPRSAHLTAPSTPPAAPTITRRRPRTFPLSVRTHRARRIILRTLRAGGNRVTSETMWSGRLNA